LEDFGLVTGVAGNFTKSLTEIHGAESNLPFLNLPFQLKRNFIMVRMARPVSVTFPNVLLTRIGREIYSITKTEDSIDVARAFADQFPKQNVEVITYLAANEESVTLWSKPSEQSP
jgi:hypothetical protein